MSLNDSEESCDSDSSSQSSLSQSSTSSASSSSSSTSSDNDSSSSQASESDSKSMSDNDDEESHDECESCGSKDNESSNSSEDESSDSSSDNDGSYSDSESGNSSDYDEENGDEESEADNDNEEEEEDDYDEEASCSSDSSRSSSHSSSNKFRYSNVVLDKATNNNKRDAMESSSLKHSSSDNDNLFTSLSKSPHSLPKISFMSGMSDQVGKSVVRGLPNRHATVPAPDARPIPSKSHQSFNHQKESNNSFSSLSQSSNKPRFRTRVKKEDMLDIPITELDREILMAIGKIKRQKQRPSVDRLYNICCKLKRPELDSKEKIQALLNDMIKRSLLARVENSDKGFVSYRELNSAIPIVAINNPLKSRVHLIEKTNDDINTTNVSMNNVRTSKCTSPTFPKSSPCSAVTFKQSKSIESSAIITATTTTKMKTVSTSTMTNSIDESIERVVRRFCKDDNKHQLAPVIKTMDNHRTASTSSERLRKCGMCGKSDKNELITCSVCGMSGHSTCLGCSETLLKRIKEFPNWECPNCKKCPVCGEHDDETNIICVICDRAFHRSCLRMNPSNSVFLSKYTCDDCDRISTTTRNKYHPLSSKSIKTSSESYSIHQKISSSKESVASSSKKEKSRLSTTTTTFTPIIKAVSPKSSLSESRTVVLKRPSIHQLTRSVQQQQNSYSSSPSRVYDTNSPDNSSLDCNKRDREQDFTKKYLGRRGRRKGSFHLKRDLVSYRVLTTQRANLAQLNYNLIKLEPPQPPSEIVSIKSNNSLSNSENIYHNNKEDEEEVLYNSDHDENGQDPHSDSCFEILKLSNSIIDEQDSVEDKVEDFEEVLINETETENMKRSSKQPLITEFLMKNKNKDREQSFDDQNYSQNEDDETTSSIGNKKDKSHQKVPKTMLSSATKKSSRKRKKFTPKPRRRRIHLKEEQSDETEERCSNSKSHILATSRSTSNNKRGERRCSRKNVSVHIKDDKQKQDTLTLASSEQKKLKNYRALSPPLPLNASLEITEEDNELFKKVQQVAENRLSSIILTPLKTQSPSSKNDGEHAQLRCPAAIEIGNYEIETWYSSLYPHEYARLQKLFICEFCLKYMKSSDMLKRHMKKCSMKKPPGDEIYRSKQVIPNFHIRTPIYLSVYEVDGANAKWYCQNLCLLGKLFIDHKTLLFDVEHFLFYILTIDDIYGSHFVGYFSKEKFSSKRYNVSCIVTLPQFQRCGFGRFLIDFSYLLSKRENLTGTPEKPLSDLGKLSYLSYWRFKIYQYINRKFRELKKQNDDTRIDLNLSVDNISQDTGLNVNDISSTLQWCNAFKKVNDEWILEFKEEEIERCLTKPRIELSEENLIWTPLVSNELQIYEDDEVYNVLFYDDALDQSEINQIKCVQMQGKLKKKRRRRWYKAYNHTNSKRRKRALKTGDHSGGKSSSVIYEDEDSQMVSAFENEDDTEEENNSDDDNSIMADDVKFLNGSLLESSSTNRSESKLSQSNRAITVNHNNTDESSCDNKLSNDESNSHHQTGETEHGNNKVFKIKRCSRSTSRSPFKKFKDSTTLLVNGSSNKINNSSNSAIVQTNGKLLNRNLSLEEDISSDSNPSFVSDTIHHQKSSNNYSCHYESSAKNSPQRHSRNLSNGVLKLNSNE